MLKLFAHELQGKYNFLIRPFNQLKRAKNFNQPELSGVEVNQNWA
jgi:hypothetical protein